MAPLVDAAMAEELWRFGPPGPLPFMTAVLDALLVQFLAQSLAQPTFQAPVGPRLFLTQRHRQRGASAPALSQGLQSGGSAGGRCAFWVGRASTGAGVGGMGACRM